METQVFFFSLAVLPGGPSAAPSMAAATHASCDATSTVTSTDTTMNALLGRPVLMDGSHRLYPNVFAKRLAPYDRAELQSLLATNEPGRMAMIVPAAMAAVSIVRVTPRRGVTDTWLQYDAAATPAEEPSLYRAGALLTGMRMPADCVVHGLIYQEKPTAGRAAPALVLGLFDMSSVGNRRLHDEPPLTRYVQLREHVPEQTLQLSGRELLVRYLWVGEESACIQALQNPTSIPNMRFHVKCVGILPTSVGHAPYQCHMLPLVVPRQDVHAAVSG